MSIPLNIAFRDFEPTESVRSAVVDHVEKLESYVDRISSCRVTLSAPHRHQHKGRIYHVSIQLHLPGKDIVVDREAEKNSDHEDIYVAIRDAFRAVERKLEEHMRKRRDASKVNRRAI